MRNEVAISLYIARIGCTLDSIVQIVSSVLCIKFDDIHIDSRVKDQESLTKKMLLKGVHDIFSIRDIYALRILLNSVEEVYLVSEILLGLFDRAYIANDFVAHPKSTVNGQVFRCIRIIAYINDVPFELQITTKDFHTMNESSHVIYKKERYG
ncbi:hypothetical protein COW81_00745 [Candidatus Campbellbacteria bacterium CG22_combo_CG10-13_8_21_14_all_36_13]|uniref:RelA/SpoT domain-containing protein n=1 Tax=Candidatus Campbellbacteria bacterium CG22_combo_CG10-13_8_21_14_all_36_13 TaxID=1974529 RepID=A0A2H0DYU8_9BACT|nr:MAG: hypothetical protein COW81_00745 [Candidatus Campbellbacteria bacterium CG22_combo_CG10-13_8_21_14_all_36_13]